MHGANWLSSAKNSPLRVLFSLFIFCAAMAIASPAQTLTTLVGFNGNNGGGPWAPLIQGTDGNFYGTTLAGGNDAPYCGNNLANLPGCGTIFRVTPSGDITTIYSFCPQGMCPDGSGPNGGLVQGTDGNFYGTTTGGGITNPPCYSAGCGTVFRITPAGVLTTLHSFCSQLNCSDGTDPLGGLVQGADGNFYGTTFGGGANGIGYGTVFKITPSGTLTTIYSFCYQSGCPDGDEPYAGLVQGADGNFYGTTSMGGTNFNNGTVFKITPGGTLTTLYRFCIPGACPDGGVPFAGLAQGTDGNFYGTTTRGGSTGNGTVFKMTPGGALTTLHSFEGSDGAQAFAGLARGHGRELLRYDGIWRLRPIWHSLRDHPYRRIRHAA